MSNERSAHILLRVTPEDHAEVKELAKQAGKSMQEFVLGRALQRDVVYTRRRNVSSAQETDGAQEQLPLSA